MFIILSNKIEGLLNVEKKILGIRDLFATAIDKFLVEKELFVALPKFKIEATVPGVKELLIQLGIKDLFDLFNIFLEFQILVGRSCMSRMCSKSVSLK